MFEQSIGSVTYRLKAPRVFDFLNRYGEVFAVFDQNDSGNISFGVRNKHEKLFIKIAGADTVNACCNPEVAVKTLQVAVSLYESLRHSRLIELIDHYSVEYLYVAVFKWCEGECLFDHWNFDRYAEKSELMSPRQRFFLLPAEQKLRVIDDVFSFLAFVEANGFVAVDFYDGSIIYDFEKGIATFCDIDLFAKAPVFNKRGPGFYGSKRFKASEEYSYGASIDSATNVFTIGALIFHFFADYSSDDIGQMYRESAFHSSRYDQWQLSEKLFSVALRAVAADRERRYASVAEFSSIWRDARG